MTKHCDVAVVGAGVAGLVAARELVRRGYRVLVTEARDRVGGRLHGVPLPGGGEIEIGGQWLGPGQDRIYALVAELGLSTFRTNDKGRRLLEFDKRIVGYTGRIPRLNPFVLADIGQAQLRLDLAARRIAKEPWQDKDAAALDRQSFADWLYQRVRTQGARDLLRLSVEAVFSAEPEEISALWALFYFGSAGGVDAVLETGGGAQQDRVVGGSHLVPRALAEELGERIVLENPVTAISWSADSVLLHGAHTDIQAKRAIVAVPPPVGAAISYDPVLPARRRELLAGLPMGRVIKFNAVYDEPFWRNEGLSGQANSTTRAAGTVYDNTPPSGSPGVLVGFLEGRHADRAAVLSAADRQQLVLDDLAVYFGPRVAKPHTYLEYDWTADEYARGGYGPYAVPGVLLRNGPALREPVGPLHWAGAETAVKWAGYIDGAVESGVRTATEVSSVLGELEPALSSPEPE
ncbi:flavin monoamine oxidase family protein [Nocardia sp. NPDC052566]|uniref:flavin monoamine oxidase family protein n=1 Tax=Nocardia sp. NPDC052566 TaxID=3364330 RepID=UPI0037C92966